MRGGAWQDEVEALQHRRGMLLRLIECAGLLIGRFAGDLHVSLTARFRTLKNLYLAGTNWSPKPRNLETPKFRNFKAYIPKRR